MARQLVVWRAGSKALADPVRLLAYAMTFGTHEDMPTFRRYVSDDDMREALERAPPGIFDGRSWSYWHLMLDRWPPPPLPHGVCRGAEPKTDRGSTRCKPSGISRRLNRLSVAFSSSGITAMILLSVGSA